MILSLSDTNFLKLYTPNYVPLLQCVPFEYCQIEMALRGNSFLHFQEIVSIFQLVAYNSFKKNYRLSNAFWLYQRRVKYVPLQFYSLHSDFFQMEQPLLPIWKKEPCYCVQHCHHHLFVRPCLRK